MRKTKGLFVKVELRLWHDPRFLILTAPQRYCYIGLIALAKQTANKIPKNLALLKAFLRLECEDSEMQVTLDCIKHHFPKFRSNKHFYFFQDYRERYTDGAANQPRNGTGKFTRNGTVIRSAELELELEQELEQEKELEHSSTVAAEHGGNSGDQYLLTLYQKLHGVTRSPETILAKIGSARSWGVTSKQIEERMYEMRNEGIKAEIWQILNPLVDERLRKQEKEPKSKW